MKNILLAFTFIFNLHSFSQCPLGNVTLNGQSEVDEFAINYPNCTEIDGDLNVFGSVTDVDALSNILIVHGSLNLTSNANLSDINGFSNITTIDNQLHIYSCPFLTDLDVFSQLTSVGSIDISNTSIFNTTGLGSITSINDGITLSYNSYLTILNGFSNLISFSGNLEISHNPNIQSIYAFNNTTSWNVNQVFIGFNDQLTNLSGLENLISCTGLSINSNPQLQSLQGLENLESTGNVAIIYNDQLSDISQLSNLNSLDAISIYGNPQLSYLTGLEGISHVPGTVNIQNNNLTDFSGLNNLSSVGSIYLMDHTNLSSLNGLENLSTVSTIMYIADNPILSDVDGLYSLSSVGGSLVIQDNFILSGLDALNHTISLGGLTIKNNLNLSTCAVQSVCDFVNVSNANIANNGAGCNSQFEVENQCDASLTQLKWYNCGEQLTTFNEPFYCDPVSAATEYEFKFEDVDNILPTTTNIRTTHSNSLQIANLLHVDKTYNVQVRAKVNGNWGVYGPVCQLHSPNSVPTTSLNYAWCGGQAQTYGDVIHAYSVSGATQYEFEFIKNGTGLPVHVLRPLKTINLDVAGLYDVGCYYDVRVRAEVNGTWGSWGAPCQLLAPDNIPSTKLRTADCGATMSSYTQIFKCDAVTGAEEYRFRFYDGTNYTIIDRPYNTNTLTLSGLLVQNTTYDVDVAIKAGGNWGPYGVVCQLTSPPTPPANLPGQSEPGIYWFNQSAQEVSGLEQNEQWLFKTYPNPANEVLYINTNAKNYGISIYSLNGQLIYRRESVTSSSSVELGDIETGIYILQIFNQANEPVESRKISIIH